MRGYARGSNKGVYLAYFAGAPAKGEESGATTAGAGAGMGVQEGSLFNLFCRSVG